MVKHLYSHSICNTFNPHNLKYLLYSRCGKSFWANDSNPDNTDQKDKFTNDVLDCDCYECVLDYCKELKNSIEDMENDLDLKKELLDVYYSRLMTLNLQGSNNGLQSKEKE